MLGWAWMALLALALPVGGAPQGSAGRGGGLAPPDRFVRPASVDDVARALKPSEGRPRIVHLWASWCVPCLIELPDLLATFREAEKRGVDVVLLSLDTADGEKNALKQLRKA